MLTDRLEVGLYLRRRPHSAESKGRRVSIEEFLDAGPLRGTGAGQPLLRLRAVAHDLENLIRGADVLAGAFVASGCISSQL